MTGSRTAAQGTAGVLRYDGAGFVPETGVADTAPLLAADSWLVQDGTARFLDTHRDRFTAACLEHGLAESGVEGFWHGALRRLPEAGTWFPRVELAADGRLRLRLRPAPPRGGAVVLWVCEPPDPRVCPRTKGPDIGALEALRARARGLGAHEGLLTHGRGEVLEGTTTSLLWWSGDALCVPAAQLPTLPGVTTRCIQRHARELGVEVRGVRAGIELLAECEVWAVNALHGIRPVTGWLGAAGAPGPAPRAAAWQRWWSAQAIPVDGWTGAARNFVPAPPKSKGRELG
ncbi:aminotransferase class IV [Actinocrinis puniceicyclus]|uniref:Aminotransferase class IV n=1 Tax=Actinocrinis puniceicyclus TaxID=977794 RepID=A0A8J7WMW2_9ACTN|nr:aminotransferase class IV [Actinocrinis puniceicyclus]MBS2962370.1 aminotransferase class IV [Actinocrinis puniceicyclus]